MKLYKVYPAIQGNAWRYHNVVVFDENGVEEASKFMSAKQVSKLTGMVEMVEAVQ